MKGTKVSAIIVLALLLGLGNEVVQALQWDVQIVDGEESGSETGTFSNIVIDSQDRPRISYYDGGDNCLRFAAWNGTSWERETVDPGGPDDEYAQGRFNCMIIDSRDRCHISYRDRRYFRLKYVVQDGAGGWEPVQVVDDPGPIVDPDGKGKVGVGRFTSIDLDSHEYPHISYTDLDHGSVKYAKWNGSSWETETVYSSGIYRAIQGTSIQVDSHDRPHIAFRDVTSLERFKCARWNGSSWDIETIDPAGGSDQPRIMAIDSKDILHICYGNAYYRSNGSAWIKELIPNVKGGGTAIKLDENDYPHIAHTQNNNMWYLYWDGTQWIDQCVDDSPEAGEERCIALDGRGVPHLSYWAQKFYDENQLRYATVICPNPNTNSDSSLDWLDLNVLAENWLWSGHPGDNPGDFSCDGTVEFKDFALIGQDWLLYTPPGMVLIHGGEFEMGDHYDVGDADEKPVHAVYVDSFYMDEYEVTNQQYCDFLNSPLTDGRIEILDGVVYGLGGTVPYCDTQTSSPYSKLSYARGVCVVSSGKEDHPMLQVSWYGAAAYCNWLSSRDGYESCYNLSTWECDFSKNGYRLPTEAQWEYAARGGLQYSKYPWGNEEAGTEANWWNSGDPYEDGPYPWTTPVGFYEANGYGLYDMAGNIWEWCNDWYDPGYYSVSPYDNPTGPASADSCILRGGSWSYDPWDCRLAYRFRAARSTRYHIFGFRTVLTPD